MAGEAPGVPSSSMILAPSGKRLRRVLPCSSPPMTLLAPTWANKPLTPSARRSMVTTGMPASITCWMTEVKPSLVRGLTIRPSYPWAMTLSRSATCLVVSS